MDPGNGGAGEAGLDDGTTTYRLHVRFRGFIQSTVSLPLSNRAASTGSF